MKTLQIVAITLLTLTGLLSCETDQQSPKPEQPSKGTATEVGKPLGATTSKIIGAQGGSISTPDGKLTLAFPAGALTKETNITIRPVENKAWGGVGTGYEFGPDGSEFAKPVTFTYKYNDKEMSGVSLDNMALAFQDQTKIWQMTAPLTVNTSQKTITGAIRHFSWWSMITRYRLLPEYDTVQIKQTKELQVEFLDNGFEWPWTDSKTPPADLALLIPLNAPKLADRTDITKLYLNGVDCTNQPPKDATSGLLGFVNKGNKAVILYTAPNKKPADAYNPVAISVELSHGGKAKLLLVSNLYINTENSFSVDGSDPTNIAIHATASSGLLYMNFEDNLGNTLTVYCENLKVGKFPFNIKNTYVGAVHPSKKKAGSSIYKHCREDKSESGTIIIEKLYKADGKTIMKGQITGTVCTRHEADEKCNVIVHETMKVSADFTTVLDMY
ncbi:hypothetical protein [Emticicia sp. BO119]|uniref:hypothetical protein n=1 Tax=Emticicia sp. BO119 TaxID=2757768 RepID=UPI0015F0D7F1|nr:hypothetical protein [Emticicia sp. BO119]MBA4850995.1 hypothetical protein [Emticicia sp. BO119]